MVSKVTRSVPERLQHPHCRVAEEPSCNVVVADMNMSIEPCKTINPGIESRTDFPSSNKGLKISFARSESLSWIQVAVVVRYSVAAKCRDQLRSGEFSVINVPLSLIEELRNLQLYKDTAIRLKDGDAL